MKLSDWGYKKSENIRIAEEIYALKAKKLEVEHSLYSEKFHYSYIAKRKNITRHEVVFRLIFIIPLTMLIISLMSLLIYYFFHPDEIDGMSFFFAISVVSVGGYADIRLLMREFRMLLLLKLSLHPEKAYLYSKKHNIRTFEEEEVVSKKRIEALELEWDKLCQEIMLLEKKQKDLFANDNVLCKKEIQVNEVSGIEKIKGKFSLREEYDIIDDEQEYWNALLQEETYIKDCISGLEEKLHELDQQRDVIYNDFEKVKKYVLYFGIVYILLVLIQGGFSGIAANVFSMICMVVMILFMFWLNKKCTQPVIKYLVEQESSLIQEYAFRNDLIPTRVKCEEIAEKKKRFQLEVEGIEQKKKVLLHNKKE